ncbi:MAG: hypothetical protein O2923_03875 [Verrucomicrobia bacterium]|nr:hypothetical protein [Verrucomicrobiota bacterium]
MSKHAWLYFMPVHFAGLCCFLVASALCAAADGREAEELAAHILKTRGEPLRELRGLREFHVKDFGAIPDDGRNDFEAIRKALTAAVREGGRARLMFESGRYDIDPGNGPYLPKEDPLLLVRRARDFVVDGQGAEIVLKRPSMGFCRIDNSTNVIFRNFTRKRGQCLFLCTL